MVAAFNGYGFAIKCPSITKLPIEEQAELWKIVLDRYGIFREIHGFGQAGTKLSIFLRK